MREGVLLVTRSVTSALLAVLMAASAHADPGARVIDKPLQRRLQVQTVLPQPATATPWPARVIADPRGLWRVAADQRGLVEPPAGGFAAPGTVVQAGQVLAWLRPAVADPEWRDLQSAHAVAERDYEVADLKIRRFDIDAAQELDIQLPTPSIQLIADYRGSQARRKALGQALGDRVALRAPAAGRLLGSLARSGVVADAGAALFEGIDTGQADGGLLVEALVPPDDLHTLRDSRRAQRLHGEPLTLVPMGAVLDPDRRSARLWFAAAPATRPGTPLAIGEPVLIEPLPAADGPGPASDRPRSLPRTSLFRHDGGDWVWVHESAERFVARAVTVLGLDVDRAWIDSAFSAEARVVADATPLLRAGPGAGLGAGSGAGRSAERPLP